ncbi:MAG: lipid-binding SYLF domain-containing protein [Phycisphaerales bacterium]
MKKYLIGMMFAVVCVIGFLTIAGCATAPATVEGKTDIRDDAAVAVGKAKTSDPTLANVLDSAAGYAVFPSVGKGAAGIGGAYGKGVLYERGIAVGYCDLSQATIGFQLGGQAYTEIIAFETQQAVNTFKQGNFRFDAQATAVALKSGAGANAKYANGVAVFTMDEAGLMYEASVGGQKFSYQAR